MRLYFRPAAALAMLMLAAGQLAHAQNQEVGLTLGGLLGQDRTAGNVNFRFSSGLALAADYEHRLTHAGPVDIYAGIHFLANAQRTINSSYGFLTRDVATIYLTPGLLFKVPLKGPVLNRVTPWATLGGGYGDYEQSTRTLSGLPNPAPRELARGVFTFGGGVDVPFWRFVGLRAEVRDFYTGTPAYNVSVGGGQHNVVAGGGIVLHFGRK